MALPVDRFITPEQNFEGLYRYSGRLEQNRLRQEQEKQAAAGRKAASDKYFANYLDPKERFTGTMADPVITDKLAKALDQAFELSAKGATDNEIFMAITPLVNDANEYTQKAKAIQAQKKQALEVLGKQKGIDPLKFSSEFDDEVFMETDTKTGVKKMRELSTVDPSQNYADAVLKNRDIYTPEGFDEYVAKAGKNTTLEDTWVYGKDKSARRTKVEMTMPSFMMSDKDEREAHVDFVPKYEIATDGDNVVMGEFMGQDGAKTKAPVRMVTNEVFNDLPVSAKAYLRQEVRRLAKEKGVDLNAAQSENLAKAIAYDELKNSGKQYSTLKEVQVQKAAPAPRVTVNVNGSGRDNNGGGKITGNVLDGMQDEDYGNFYVKSGAFYNKDGTPKEGTVFISGENLPTNIKSVLKAGGIDPNYLMKGVNAKIKNGRIESISNELIGSVSRSDMEGIYQPKFDTERKGEKLVFPNSSTKGKNWVVGSTTLTTDQIKKGAAKYKMSEEQYLKSIGAKEQ